MTALADVIPAAHDASAHSMAVLPVTALQPHPANRKHFDPVKLKELADNIAAVGQLTPVLVRPVGSGYQILAGERRWRAAKLVGQAGLVCVVHQYSDAEALEVLLVENMQREDVHPLEEASAYAQLLEQPGYDVLRVAQKVGKSESYVRQRIQLAKLHPDLQMDYWAGKMLLGHAILLARLAPPQQLTAYDRRLRWRGDEVIPVKDLEDYLQRDVYLDLATAPWKKDDATLVAAAGSCHACPKRSGAEPSLFPEVKKKDLCLDRTCFEEKKQAFVARTIATVAAKHGVQPVLVSGSYSGKKGVLSPYDFKAAEKGDKGAVPSISIETYKTSWVIPKKPARHPRSTNGEGTWQEQEKKRQAEAKVQETANRALMAAVVAKLPQGLDRTWLQFLTQRALELVGSGFRDEFALLGFAMPKGGGPAFNKALKATLATLDGDALARLLILSTLVDQGGYGEPAELIEAATLVGLDAKAILATAKKAAKEPPAPKVVKTKKRAGDVARAKAKKAKKAKVA